MISVLLPAFNSESLIKNVFRECRSMVPIEIIAYDNGGNGKEVNRDLAIKWIGDGKNVGLNVALNACAKAARYNYFYLPHTDMMLLPHWDTSLLKQAKKYAPGTFLFCSRSIEKTKGHTDFHIIKDVGDDPDNFDAEQVLTFRENYSSHKIVSGYRMPFFLDRTLWEKMGGVDEKYFSYASDDDLFMSAYDVGVRKFWMINNSLVCHLQGKSNAGQKVDKDQNWPYEYFKKKWAKKGYDTDKPIDSLMQSLIPWYQPVN